MEIDTKTIAQLRKETGVGIIECKKALEETNGDLEKAKEILRKKGAQKSAKRAARTASEGVVASYIHSNKKIGVMVELNSETDFVARNPEFEALAKDLAMHIAASAPLYVSREDVPDEVLAKEKEIYREQLKAENKPEAVMDKIIEGKLNKYYEEVCLLEQTYIRDDEKKIGDLLDEIVSKMGEKIVINRFIRYQI